MKKTNLVKIHMVCILAVCVLAGCASFSGKRLPTCTYAQLQSPPKKVTATYDVKAFNIYGIEDKIAATRLDFRVHKVLSSSLIFTDIKPGFGQGDYHYSFIFRSDGMPPAPVAFLNGVVSGLTLCMIPAFARDIFIITVEVKQDNRVLKSYTYTDHMDTWIQLFLIALTPFNFPSNISDAVIENIIMNFLYDFTNDIHSGSYLAKQI